MALKASPNRLDPAFAVDVGEGEICTLLYQSLVRFSPRGELIPDAARDWSIEDSGRRYVFHLDRRASFTSGQRVTAADVVFSFTRVLSPEEASPRRWVLDRIRGADAFVNGAGGVDGLSAPDDSTVVIELASPFRPFLSMLAMPAAMIVREGSVDAGAPAGQPIGSGRWQLARWERADYLSLVPNPHHPRPISGLSELRFRIITEPFTRIAEFESGGLDVLEIPPVELPRFRSDPKTAGRIQDRSELRVYYIGLNNTRGPLRDPRVRRALNMSVDVDRLIDVLAGGEALRASGSIPPGLPGFVERDPWNYDPAAARRLLAEAGYPDGFALEIWQRQSREGNRFLEAIQGYLLQCGVQVKLVRREWSAFKQAASSGKIDAFFLDWVADYPDAENFLYPLFHTANAGGGGNRVFFSNPEVDALIEKASRTVDAARCAELYARVDSLVYDQAPWLYLFFPRTSHVVSERVRGYQLPSLYLGADYSTVSLLN